MSSSLPDPGGDPYTLLNITFDATDSIIKAAFRVRARDVHPDKNPAPHAALLFHAIKIASEALLDVNTRSVIDVRLAAARAVAARQAALGEGRARARVLLETREAAAAASVAVAARSADVARLRRDGVDRVRAMVAEREAEEAAAAAERANQAAAATLSSSTHAPPPHAIIVTWTEGVSAALGLRGGVTDAALQNAFYLCGAINRIEGKALGRALIIFVSEGGAEAAIMAPPAGFVTRRIEIDITSSLSALSDTTTTTAANAANNAAQDLEDLEIFEKNVLQRCFATTQLLAS
jgi:hypothetical protein